MKNLCLLLMVFFVFIFVSQAGMAHDFNLHSFANADYVQLIVYPKHADLIKKGIEGIEAKIIIDSPFAFVPVGDYTKEIAKNSWQVRFFVDPLTPINSALFYAELARPQFFKFEVKVLGEGKEISRIFDLEEMSTILTITPEPDAFLDLADSVREMDQALLIYDLLYPETGVRWDLLAKDRLISFLTDNEPLRFFCPQRILSKGWPTYLNDYGWK